MGRELRRKQAKREGKSLKEEKENKKEVNPYNDINKMLKTFAILLGIILIIYFLVALFITKEIDWFSNDNENANSAVSVKNSILAKNTFMQTEEVYYVYYYDFNDQSSSIASLISSKLSSETVYKVDTSDAFNSNYVTEEVGNSAVSSIDDLKVINPTLIKISNGSVIEYYETEDSIINYLEK